MSDLKRILKWARTDHDIIHLDELMGGVGAKDPVHHFNIANDRQQYRRAAFGEIAIERCEANGL